MLAKQLLSPVRFDTNRTLLWISRAVAQPSPVVERGRVLVKKVDQTIDRFPY